MLLLILACAASNDSQPTIQPALHMEAHAVKCTGEPAQAWLDHPGALVFSYDREPINEGWDGVSFGAKALLVSADNSQAEHTCDPGVESAIIEIWQE